MATKKNLTANMKDVAALAQVSIATVSRYLNGHIEKMMPETADRVKDAIEKLNYVPNSAARQMITKASNIIAVVVSNIDDYYSTELFKGISSILETNGYIGVLFDSDSKELREKKLLESVNLRSYDGLILQPITLHASNISNTIRRQIPIVLVDREVELAPWPQVLTNNYQAAREAMLKFTEDGYKHVILLTSKISSFSTRTNRYRGIKSVTDNIDIVEVDEDTYRHDDIMTQLTTAIQKNSEKTLIFSLREYWLLEFLPQLIAHGYVDGSRVTVTGFSDTGMLHEMVENAKFINQNPFLIGATAAELLVARLKNDNSTSASKIVVPAKLS